VSPKKRAGSGPGSTRRRRTPPWIHPKTCPQCLGTEWRPDFSGPHLRFKCYRCTTPTFEKLMDELLERLFY
jgi:hypothetical protein